MRIDDIKIFPCFAEHSPKVEKMQQKEQYFTETGLLQSQIILDSRGNLIDGYTSYLLAVKYGLQSVSVEYGKRQIVRASQKKGGKLYTWELPGLLIDRVHIGDKVIVHSNKGIRTVTVAAVEDYSGQEPEPLKMAIRIRKRYSGEKAARKGERNNQSMKNLLSSQVPCVESDTGSEIEDAMTTVYREKIVQRINGIDNVDFLEFLNNMLDAFKMKWRI